jgi:hypothetical protein
MRRHPRGWRPRAGTGVARLHAMIGEHVEEDTGPVEVVIGIETDRGPWVQALVV